MRVPYTNSISTIMLSILMLAVIQSGVSGCSSGPSREQRVKAQQERAAEAKLKQQEEMRDVFKLVSDHCAKKGLHKIVIQYKNGSSMHCVPDYEACIEQVIKQYNERVEFDTPLSAEQKTTKATKLCQKAFPEQKSQPSKSNVPYTPSQSEKEALNKGFTPLFLACALGQIDRVRDLLEGGANPNERTKNGNTPLSVAAVYGTANMVTLLIDSGAKINTKNSKTGYTPLMAAAAMDNIEAATILIERGADATAINNKGLTAIEIAQQSKKIDPALIQVLLKGEK